MSTTASDAASGADENPEVGRTVDVDGIATNYHDMGDGSPVLFHPRLRPGRVRLGELAAEPADDLAHRGAASRPTSSASATPPAPEGFEYTMERWVEAPGGPRAGARPGGRSRSWATRSAARSPLAYAIRHPESVRGLVLMGSVGVDFELTEGARCGVGLRAVGGEHEAAARRVRPRRVVHDRRARRAPLPGLDAGRASRRASRRCSPHRRQASIRAMQSDEADIRRIDVPALVVHGREDKVIPVANAHRLFELLPDSELPRVLALRSLDADREARAVRRAGGRLPSPSSTRATRRATAREPLRPAGAHRRGHRRRAGDRPRRRPAPGRPPAPASRCGTATRRWRRRRPPRWPTSTASARPDTNST